MLLATFFLIGLQTTKRFASMRFLLGWWHKTKSLFLSKQDSEQRFDIYAPRERLIYSYFDGEKQVLADPLELYQKVMDVWPGLRVDLKLAESALIKEKESNEAYEKVVAKVREIFNIKNFKDGGLTKAECCHLLDHFFAFFIQLKKNSPPLQTSLESSEDSSPSSEEDDPPTDNSSDSGSTDEGPFTGGPVSSPSGPVSPSTVSSPETNTGKQ